MPVCKLLQHKEAINNTKQFLVDTGGLKSMQSTEIADVALLRQGLKKLESLSIKSYGIPGRPWLEDSNGTNVYPNGKVLAAIDRVRRARGLYEGKFPANYQPPQQVVQQPQIPQPVSVVQAESQRMTNQNVDYQVPSTEGQIASEKTIRDLAARISDRIGIPYRIISDRTQQFKGKLEKGEAVINLAYATLDTPIHEILGHPIIRAIRGDIKTKEQWKNSLVYTIRLDGEEHDLSDEAYSKYVNQQLQNRTLYQNLLKELEYGKGKEVLDRVKKDYLIKNREITNEEYEKAIKAKKYINKETPFYPSKLPNGSSYVYDKGELMVYWGSSPQYAVKIDKEEALAYVDSLIYKYNNPTLYSLEEQQEEAIVELLGMMTAEKLDAVKDGKLISLLKRLLKEMKQFVRSLLSLKEVEINKLPDNMTIGDIADLLAYSNSKLILPGYEVEYTTPDNQKFKTYAEASNHISQLVKSIEDVDLSDVKIEKKTLAGEIDPITGKKIKSAKFKRGSGSYFSSDDNQYEPGEPDSFEIVFEDDTEYTVDSSDLFRYYDEKTRQFYDQIRPSGNSIESFIESNKKYEQSKEVIEEWKKVNGIQYNPEEIYSRGQEFVSVVGAYSSFDVNLMMQNLLQHIEDNQKAGGEFTISAFTKPIDKTIGHLEGGGGKIKFKIYPQSQDIKWAANTDVYSGSVWDAAEKVNKDKKSELLGVSYTKYPSPDRINAVQPNLAFIVDRLAHHHNELGISLNGTNFRLEYDEDIPYQTKKIIDSINSILDQKYGKLVKPEIKEQLQKEVWEVIDMTNTNDIKVIKTFETEEEAENWYNQKKEKAENFGVYLAVYDRIKKGIQPTQTEDNLKESIEYVKDKISGVQRFNDSYNFKEFVEDFEYIDFRISEEDYDLENFYSLLGILKNNEEHIIEDLPTKELAEYRLNLYKNKVNKKYTEQALINTKITKLKEVAKKYPRSLITSKVVEIKEQGFKEVFGVTTDDLPWQKIPNLQKFQESLTFPQFLKGKLEGSKMTTEIEGKLGADKERLIDLLGSSMYSEKLKDVVYKELLQNAFDAIKIAEAKGLIDKGKIDIVVDKKERTITFTDNGIGMTPEIVQKAFFTIGGTYKGDNVDNKLKSGGLGLAKMAFIFGSEELILETIHDGIKTSVNATSKEIRSDNFKIITNSTTEKNGTKVTVKIPESYINSKGETRSIDFPFFIKSELEFSFLKNPLIGNVDVTYSIINKGSYEEDEKINTELGKIPEGYILFSPATTSFADIDIYIDTQNIGKKSWDTKHEILSSGLHQFNMTFNKKVGDEKIPLNIIINIKPKVEATNTQYPFNNQRENFRPTVKNDVVALGKYLQLLWHSIEIQLLKQSFSKIQNIDVVNVESPDDKIIEKNKQISKKFEKQTNEEIVRQAINDFIKDNQKAEIKDGSLSTKSQQFTAEQISKENEKDYNRTFKAERKIDVNKDTNFNLDPEKPFIHNNTTLDFNDKAIKFISEISSIMLEYKQSIIDFYGEDYSPNLKTQLWGVSIDKTYGGVNVNPSFVNMLAINPFYQFPDNPKINAVNYIAVALDHLIIHELNHNFERNEGAGFTGRFLQTYSEIHSLPNHFQLISKLKLSIKNNLETIKILNYEYKQSENVESGFEGNKLEENNQRGTSDGAATISENDSINNARTEENDTRSSDSIGELLESISKQDQATTVSEPQSVDTNKLNQIQQIFEDNPELSQVGTMEQYAAYLDTIFPDSKVKDIVYHFTTKKNKEKILEEGFKINKPIESDISFSKDNTWKDDYRSETIYSLLNIKNPKGYDRYSLREKKELDSTVDGGINIKTSDTHYATVVFKPEQIHILASKQDIEGFKNFTQPKISNELENIILSELQNKSTRTTGIDTSVLSDGKQVLWGTLNSNESGTSRTFVTALETVPVGYSDTLRERTAGRSFNEVWSSREFSQLEREQILFASIVERLTKSPNSFNGKLFKYIKEKFGQLESDGSKQSGIRFIDQSELPPLFVSNGYIYVNRSFYQYINTLNIANLDEYLEISLSEELIHLVTDNLMTNEEYLNILAEIPSSVRQKVQVLYPSVNFEDPVNSLTLIDEYLRMLIQESIFGKTTELVKSQSSEGLSLLERAWEFIKGFLRSNYDKSPFTASVVNKSLSFISESQRTAPTYYQLSPNEVNYQLKTVSIVTNNIQQINKLFSRLGNTDQFWNKIQQDFQIPKDQIELLKNSEGNTIEEKLISFAANYSFAVEINIAKKNYDDDGEDSNEHFELNVPGGTNYKINVFKTPLILPSIINHFFHKNQIGWFRSDEKVIGGENIYPDDWEGDSVIQTGVRNLPVANIGGEQTKTRRILEVQSDLFQKGRDQDDLTRDELAYLKSKNNDILEDKTDFYLDGANYRLQLPESEEDFNLAPEGIPTRNGKEITYNQFQEAYAKRIGKNVKGNQFLQLLNKNNNWVTFFVRAIIQSTAKERIYEASLPDIEEKVLSLQKEGKLKIDCR